MQWFLQHRSDLEETIAYCHVKAEHGHRLLAIPSKKRLERILKVMLDESEFLSPFGIRSLSKVHEKTLHRDSRWARAKNRLFPWRKPHFPLWGNSNWRGPIWLPLNFLLIEALSGMTTTTAMN